MISVHDKTSNRSPYRNSCHPDHRLINLWTPVKMTKAQILKKQAWSKARIE